MVASHEQLSRAQKASANYQITDFGGFLALSLFLFFSRAGLEDKLAASYIMKVPRPYCHVRFIDLES